jgi:quinol monooxygenase YgiN
MIYGVVSIRVKPGKGSEFIELFNSNAVTVREEEGCFRYMLTADVDSGSPIQTTDKEVLTLLEEWGSLEDISRHLAAPHMSVYFQREKDLVDEVIVKMLQEV